MKRGPCGPLFVLRFFPYGIPASAYISLTAEAIWVFYALENQFGIAHCRIFSGYPTRLC